ncbi:MAG: VTT domain-containing protein [Thermodesulfobacteriota bacterium]|nr:VTT domain-containing protein [Thermodesulfobacteriota bacterium]
MDRQSTTESYKLRFAGGFIIIIGLIVIGAIIHHFYGSISVDTFRTVIKDMSWGGVFVYIMCFTLGIIFFVPATPLAVIGGLIFGPWLGFIALQVSSLVSACAIFMIVRMGIIPLLIKENLRTMIPHRIYSMVHNNALLLIVYARTFMIPAAAINYGASPLPISFSDYFIGTLLGSLPHNLAVALLCGVAHDALLEGRWLGLLQWELIPAAVITVFNIYLAHVLNRRDKRQKNMPF